MTAYDLNITSHKNMIIKNPQKMLYRKKTSVVSGISFHPYQWEAVCAAAKVLVPDSDQSYSSAGPEVDGIVVIELFFWRSFWRSATSIRRKKNGLSESRKNQYNIYIEKADAICM